MLPDAEANPTFGIFPSIFWLSDSPHIVTIVLVTLALAALAFACGFYRRPAAAILWYGWACLFNRNVLTSNPSLSYVGLILILTLFIPPAEPLTWRRRERWEFPLLVYETAWWLLAIGYTFSGLIKLQSPSWIDGTALIHLMTNPLARPSMLRDLFLSLPPVVLYLHTWAALTVEILYLPLAALRRTRPVIWLAMIFLHLGILVFVDFVDLTLGMLMAHFFVFDPTWLPSRKDGNRRIVFFDGSCGLCQRSVQLLLDADRDGILQFAPLQGETAKDLLPEALRDSGALNTMVFYRDGVPAEVRSSAALSVLSELGGFERVVATLKAVPRPVRDWVYGMVASNRHRLSRGKFCRLPTPEESKRILP